MNSRSFRLLPLVASLAVFTARAAEGYTDTPMQPDGKWHVHDPARPKPKVITPGANFSHGVPAPSDVERRARELALIRGRTEPGEEDRAEAAR